MNDTKWQEVAQAEDMAYFRAGICCYSPESYMFEEKRQICNDMVATSKAALVAIREDFDSQPPELCERLLAMICEGEPDNADWWHAILVGDGDPLYNEFELLNQSRASRPGK